MGFGPVDHKILIHWTKTISMKTLGGGLIGRRVEKSTSPPRGPWGEGLRRALLRKRLMGRKVGEKGQEVLFSTRVDPKTPGPVVPCRGPTPQPGSVQAHHGSCRAVPGRRAFKEWPSTVRKFGSDRLGTNLQ